MRLNNVLFKHNLYRLMKQHWKVQRKKVLVETHAKQSVEGRGFQVVNVKDIIDPKIRENLNIVGMHDLPILKDENHPLYQEVPCYFFKDNNVLIEGLDQALVLTNSVLVHGFETEVDDHKEEENLLQRCIKSTFLYDAEQIKLPKRKDPERPAWCFPRDYGISDRRRNRLLGNRLLQLCAMTGSTGRSTINDALFSVPLTVDNNRVQIEIRSDILITASEPLQAIQDPAVSKQFAIPDISPVHPLISFEKSHFYELQDIFPIKPNSQNSYAHTAFIHFNGTEVTNLYETPVTDSQIMSRSLVKSYAIAVAQARHTYGPKEEKLSQPITVQAVHTDGQRFAFSILQLNTLSDEENVHNVFYTIPIMQLFSQCEYVNGKPVLQDYNPEVFRRVLAFYKNDSKNPTIKNAV